MITSALSLEPVASAGGAAKPLTAIAANAANAGNPNFFLRFTVPPLQRKLRCTVLAMRYVLNLLPAALTSVRSAIGVAHLSKKAGGRPLQ
jgi:hypothetical protein